MAAGNKCGYPLTSEGALTDVDTAQRNPLGLRQFDDIGNEYVYLPGVASLAAGDFVIYGNNLTFVPARLLNDAGGQGAGAVALAMAAILAANWGWFQIYGVSQANAAVATTASVGVQLYRSSTAGRASASAVAKDCVYGALTAAASVANVGQVFLTYPKVADQSTL